MRVTYNQLHTLCADILHIAGLRPEDARTFADSLVFSELRGVSSHGVTRLEAYAEKIRLGQVNPRPSYRVIRQAPSTLTVDADNAPGVLAGVHAMEMCIERAAKTGVGLCAVGGSSHFAAGGYFAMLAARRDMIGIAMCNCDASVVPHGGARALLGTNPLAAAVPAGRHDALLVDMATSLVAKGKVNLAEKLGKPIPPGWIVDAQGQPTTNPAHMHTGSLLPFGGAKGYGIALLVELLSSALSGGKGSGEITSFFNSDDPAGFQNIGMLFGAIDISKFVEPAQFLARVDSLFDLIAACPPAPGFDAVRYPGQRGGQAFRTGLEQGVELPDETLRSLDALARRYRSPHSLCRA